KRNALGVDIEERLFEGQSSFEVVYRNVQANTIANDSQLSVGMQQNSTSYTLVGCDPTGGQSPPVNTGQRYTYTYNTGTCLTNTPTITNTRTTTNTPTHTPT